jgi:antitoxin CptB
VNESEAVVRRRLRWRCRRGLLELDLLLARFLDRGYECLDRGQRAAFERLLTVDDNTLLAYLNGTRRPDETEFSSLVAYIRTPTRP